MKKILGIAVVLVLAGATASANERTTGPPTDQSANFAYSGDTLDSDGGVAASDISILFDNVVIGHKTDVVASSVGVIFNDTAFFMGDETDDGMMKGPRATAIFMSEGEAKPTTTAVIHSPPLGSCGIFVSIAS